MVSLYQFIKIDVSLSRENEVADSLLVAVGAKGVEYPQRFFARDFAGNRLEFSL